MHADEIMQLFERVGAVRHGHFELSSGRHSATYVQCALVLQYPESAEKLGRALAEKFKGVQIDCVASPALGGVLVGHEVARGLGVRSVFGTVVQLNHALHAGALIDRSGNQLELNVPSKALIDLDIPSYEAVECPLCRSGQEIAKPGSHFVRSEK